MHESLKPAVSAIQQRFAAEASDYRGETTLLIQPDQLLDIAGVLRDEFQFNMLMDVTAVDYWPQEKPRLHVIYQLYSMPLNQQLRLRCPLDGNAPRLSSVEGVWPNANWYEREVYDMFGVFFEGHSDLRRIIMPADWQGHPLRKDYPLGYEEVQFSFNYDEIEAKKPKGKLQS